MPKWPVLVILVLSMLCVAGGATWWSVSYKARRDIEARHAAELENYRAEFLELLAKYGVSLTGLSQQRVDKWVVSVQRKDEDYLAVVEPLFVLPAAEWSDFREKHSDLPLSVLNEKEYGLQNKAFYAAADAIKAHEGKVPR